MAVSTPEKAIIKGAATLYRNANHTTLNTELR
jgi:hypothetical protein